ncbi:protein MEMO1-like [Notamacropus eugenii]|uniref:protein MEMO1-like n=1 Tax=Notamacropus eugenii TaxID=9315 RepID=UPI003B67A900
MASGRICQYGICYPTAPVEVPGGEQKSVDNVNKINTFDNVIHEGLWKIVTKFVCLEKASILHQFSDSRLTCVLENRRCSWTMQETSEVKQVYVLASMLFSTMFLETLSDTFKKNENGTDALVVPHPLLKPFLQPPSPPPPHSSSCIISSTGSKISNRVACQEASHARSWYTASGPQLNVQLEGWLSQVQSTRRPTRAIIASPMESHMSEFTINPVLVGALSESKEQKFGKLFSKCLVDSCNLFVVSSDFCHWDQRFCYSYYDESQGDLYRSIEHLDKMGMSIIEQLDPISFSNCLKKYHSIICGKRSIWVLLNAITELQKNGMNMSFSFLNYAQSNQCRNGQDSSVSYAAGALTVR